MDQRIYHGQLSPHQVAQALLARFNRGNLRAQEFAQGDKVVVQIATRQRVSSGGATALSVQLNGIEEGVLAQIGRQAWLGVAASLGTTALFALRNPLSLLGRLDDLAQDIEYLTLAEQVWQAIDETARAAGATKELSERLRRIVCEYCLTANEVGAAACIACGAPLGRVQPGTCRHCGYVMLAGEQACPNCLQPVAGKK
jgi:hypothetical protein